jgi:hypothetical protein
MTSNKRKSDQIFECRMCGDCCKGYGGTYLRETDVAAIAAYLGIDVAEFKSAYCESSGSKTILAQQPNGYCVFWNNLCTIHPVKPRMCRQWPYIKSVLIDVENWYAMGTMCPGIRQDVSPQEIRRTVARMLEKEGCGGH